MPMPSVVMMSRYRPHAGKVNFTRRNIYLRDGFKCQYCLKILSTEQLTIDHVIPKSRGGGTRWDNVVAACHRCNLRKGANIEKPVKKPYEPNYWKMVELAKSLPLRIPDPQWQDYLQWPEDLIQVVRAKAA
jgi:Restriction endonuclease